ncbi:hypothetical protein BDY21DRAFT_340864 [Lineolata rhizophorae]|uniref:Uncharacterized protein n=1 Tax=Lineolata rhizophorae TaxID=578093 RepID=A0A6A6P431_9PEZI|nr:hypothetical protein BDY21DRAFT_340864 [Lineolata rhizophorae]
MVGTRLLRRLALSTPKARLLTTQLLHMLLLLLRKCRETPRRTRCASRRLPCRRSQLRMAPPTRSRKGRNSCPLTLLCRTCRSLPPTTTPQLTPRACRRSRTSSIRALAPPCSRTNRTASITSTPTC